MASSYQLAHCTTATQMELFFHVSLCTGRWTVPDGRNDFHPVVTVTRGNPTPTPHVIEHPSTWPSVTKINDNTLFLLSETQYLVYLRCL